MINEKKLKINHNTLILLEKEKENRDSKRYLIL